MGHVEICKICTLKVVSHKANAILNRREHSLKIKQTDFSQLVSKRLFLSEHRNLNIDV